MANVKANLETLAEQMNFLEKTIELINSHDHSKKLGLAFDEGHLPLLENILANLRMVHSWVMLPDFHQAALQILDKAHEVNGRLQKGGDGSMPLTQYMEEIALTARRYSDTEGHNIQGEVMMKIASIALIAVAKFVVPTKPVKEVSDGN